MFDSLNYLAILVAAILAFGVGGLWYGPLFGKQWRRLMGVGEGMGGGKYSMSQAMGMGFVATLIFVFVLAIFAQALLINTFVGSIVLGFWVWLGFVATIMANSVFYEGRSWQLYAINVSHYFVAIILASVVLALW